MSRQRAAAAAVIAVVVAGIAALLVLAVRGGGSTTGSASGVTDPARFDLPALAGSGRVRLADQRGHPLVVTMFASWCTACRGELPGFNRVRTALGGAVSFVAVDSLDGGDGLGFARELGIGGWPLAKDVGGTNGSGLHDAFGLAGLPVTAFYSASGHMLRLEPGGLTTQALDAQLRTLYHLRVPDIETTPVP